MTLRKHTLQLGAIALCLAASFAAQAQTTKKAAAPKTTAVTAAPAASASAAEKPVSAESLAAREQLRQCLDTEDTLRSRKKTYDQEFEAISAESADVQAEGKTMAEAQTKLDVKDVKAVDAFNKTLLVHNDRITVVNDKARAYEARKVALNGDVETFNAGCATYKYATTDRDAVMKERVK